MKEEYRLYSSNAQYKYYVSNFGNVKVFSAKTNIELNRKPQDNGCGYLKIAWKYVHRMVAETFLDKEDGKDFVNHKDGNKKNNHVNNLEWCTRSENMQHAFENGLANNFHTEESKDKISKSRKGIKPQLKNRQYNCVCKICKNEFKGKNWNSSKCNNCKK